MNFKEFAKPKILYIMRGVSGSGKSTLAHKIQQREGGVVYGSDDFRYVNGVYTFDPKTDIKNHKRNIWRTHMAMQQGITPIIIDNTNVKFVHAEPYIIDGLNHGYDIKVVEPNTPWAFDAEELSKRNSHRAPLSVIKTMLYTWEPHEEFERKIKSFSPALQTEANDPYDPHHVSPSVRIGVTYNGDVESYPDMDSDDHAALHWTLPFQHSKRWRLHENGIVSWMDGPDTEDMDVTDEHLFRKGHTVVAHGSAPFREAGFSPFSYRSPSFYTEAYHNPNLDEPFKDRLGRCYELAGRFASRNRGCTLVHGSIQGFGNPRIGHAWVELPIKKEGRYKIQDIWEPTTNQELSKDAFERLFNPIVDVKYKGFQITLQMAHNHHWGPWDKIEKPRI